MRFNEAMRPDLTHTDLCQETWAYGLCHNGKTLC